MYNVTVTHTIRTPNNRTICADPRLIEDILHILSSTPAVTGFELTSKPRAGEAMFTIDLSPRASSPEINDLTNAILALNDNDVQTGTITMTHRTMQRCLDRAMGIPSAYDKVDIWLDELGIAVEGRANIPKKQTRRTITPLDRQKCMRRVARETEADAKLNAFLTQLGIPLCCEKE